jgi:hypothetical protein
MYTNSDSDKTEDLIKSSEAFDAIVLSDIPNKGFFENFFGGNKKTHKYYLVDYNDYQFGGHCGADHSNNLDKFMEGGKRHSVPKGLGFNGGDYYDMEGGRSEVREGVPPRDFYGGGEDDMENELHSLFMQAKLAAQQGGYNDVGSVHLSDSTGGESSDYDQYGGRRYRRRSNSKVQSGRSLPAKLRAMGVFADTVLKSKFPNEKRTQLLKKAKVYIDKAVTALKITKVEDGDIDKVVKEATNIFNKE